MDYTYLNLFFLLILNSLIVKCASLDAESIVGGSVGRIGQFKYLVSVQGNEYHMCGGGIIGNQHILTAAHCFIDEDENFMTYKYSILAATIDASTPTSTESSVRIPVGKAYVASEFIRTNNNPQIVNYRSTGDIAVLKLTRRLDLIRHPNLSKLNLPKSLPISLTSFPLYVNETAMFAGFGYEGITYFIDPDTDLIVEVPEIATFKLKFAKTTVFANEVCASKYDHPIYPSHLCAQVKQRNINNPEGKCSGDSGGPLVFRETIVIGISSSSNFGCDERVSPGVYTRVTHYLPLIQKALLDINSPDIRVKVYEN